VSASVDAVVAALRSVADPSRTGGMAKVGIAVDRAIGVSIPQLRRIAKAHRGDHTLALALWGTGIHEARILASMVDDPRLVTRTQMEDWVREVDSWDLGDQLCNNLFRATRSADGAARAWSGRQPPYVRRAAFALVAAQCVHDHERPDPYFTAWLPRIRRAAIDERAVVMKAVNWSLRQIGKRNPALHGAAIEEASGLLSLDSRSARWIARDALRELRSDAVAQRLGLQRRSAYGEGATRRASAR
jgi:3-methyladenine DNA glycosylase AlkD